MSTGQQLRLCKEEIARIERFLPVMKRVLTMLRMEIRNYRERVEQLEQRWDSLDAAWNDLPLQPVFVPLVHELMKYLVAHEPSPAWYTVGDLVDAAAMLGARDQGVAVETPSGEKRILPRERPALRLEEPGWYELHAMSDPSRSGAVAVNVDPVESLRAG